jgi:hypothetical protein
MTIDERLSEIARRVTEELCPQPGWVIGDVVMHPGGYPVRIVSGASWVDDSDGVQRVSNHWSWTRVDGTGQACGPEESGYGWPPDPTVSAPSFGH